MKKLVVLSLDALGNNDSRYFENLPGFRYLIENGAYIKNMVSVFPSLTYPAHASISTGRYPRSHGIVNNHAVQPSKKKMDWFWYEKDIEGDTLLKAAARKGIKTASVLWPVSAKSSASYNIAEIIPHKKWHKQGLIIFLNSNPILLLKLYKKYGHLLNGIKFPELDDFSEAIFHDILKNKKPDMGFCHFIAVDDLKHREGTKSENLAAAIEGYDKRIQNILRLLKESGELENTNLVVLSDHSQLDVKYGLRLNSYLKDLGYLEAREDGTIKKYKAMVHSADGSAYVYTKGLSNEEEKKLKTDLEAFNEKYKGIRKIYSKDEAESLGADPECCYLLDAQDGYVFLQEANGTYLDTGKPRELATHGYSPHRDDYGAVFFACGPDFKNTTLEKARLIDIAPTLSKVMKLNLKGAEGRRITEILKEETC